jgi:hypothetical protein
LPLDVHGSRIQLGTNLERHVRQRFGRGHLSDSA